MHHKISLSAFDLETQQLATISSDKHKQKTPLI